MRTFIGVNFTRSRYKLTAADGAEGYVFGWSVALSADIAVIAAARNNDKGRESGSVYVFEINRPPAKKFK